MKPQARGGIVENLLDLFLGNDEESARLFELIRGKGGTAGFFIFEAASMSNHAI